MASVEITVMASALEKFSAALKESNELIKLLSQRLEKAKDPKADTIEAIEVLKLTNPRDLKALRGAGLLRKFERRGKQFWYDKQELAELRGKVVRGEINLPKHR